MKMTTFYAIEPEVAGRQGKKTVADRTVHPPVITMLHHVFDGWLGDEILESFPAFLVTERLKTVIESAGLTGVRFSDALEVEVSEQFREFYPERELPPFVLLDPVGVAGKDDFGLAPDHRLVVSARALQLLDSTSPSQLEREPTSL